VTLPAYPALDLLTDMYCPPDPLKRRKKPFWHPTTVPACVDQVRTPVWSWEHPDQPAPGTPLVDLDVNGAYLAAIMNCEFAFDALEHGGPIRLPNGKYAPGYYLITNHGWPDRRFPSPMGSAELGSRVWVAQPTLTLLHELSEEGRWGGIEIHGQWTSPVAQRFRKWAEAVRDDRAMATRNAAAWPEDGHAAAVLKGIKDGYSIAVQLFRGPQEDHPAKSKVRRHDWYHAVHAMHAANLWRKVWALHVAGYTPVSMGSTDRVTYTPEIIHVTESAKPPVRFDQSGVALGAFKVTDYRIQPEGEDPDAAAVIPFPGA
jgi:hypothetical protein